MEYHYIHGKYYPMTIMQHTRNTSHRNGGIEEALCHQELTIGESIHTVKVLFNIPRDDAYTAKIIENNARLDAAVTIGIVRGETKYQITSRIYI